MWIVRQIEAKDFENYESMAFKAHVGVTSLPKDHGHLKEKLSRAIKSFDGTLENAKERLFLFVLENEETKEIVGVSGINASTGTHNPLFFYNVQKETRETSIDKVSKELQLLVPTTVQQPYTELCSLYLLPEKRKEGLGHLLSFSRMLFIADNADFFEEKMTAVIRGMIDDKDFSPFWQATGRPFFNVDFVTLASMMSCGKSFVAQFLPKHPIYAALLSQEAQEAIGEPHIRSRPALEMLLNEGFHKTNDIDIMDGGPRIEANTSQLHTIKNSYQAIVDNIDREISNETAYLISRPFPTFRACLGSLIRVTPEHVVVSEATAKALDIKIGSSIRYAPNLQSKI